MRILGFTKLQVTRAAGRAAVIPLLLAMLATGVLARENPGHPAPAKRPRASRPDSGLTLSAIVAGGRLEILRWPDFSDVRLPAESLYRHFGSVPVWLRNSSPTPQSLEMISALEQADSKGLHAEDYDASRWPQRLAALKSQHSPADEFRFDVALTVCTMRYVSNLRMGRINPRHYEFGRDIGPKEFDLAGLVEHHLVRGTDLKSALTGLEPPLEMYRDLESALARYMVLAKKDDGEKLPVPRALVLFGTPYEGVPRLARLLRLVGDLPENAEVDVNGKIYDGAIVQAVKRFQWRHGLRADGYLSVPTVTELNVSLSDRAEQIRLTLERIRWLRFDYPRPPVVVNIPGFRLYAMDEEGKAALTMPVDVGQEYSPTPVLEDKIEYLVFRPYWDAPLDIVKEMVVPGIEEDPDFFADNHFEAVAPDGHVVTEGKVSEEVLRQIRSGRLHIRQKPGSYNLLGRVKFIFPNQYNVTLHDIPSGTGDFDPFMDHNISHGCIHLKEPAKLAAWVLRDQPGWNLERVQRAMEGGQDNLRVNLTKPQPVLIVYMTAAARENGEVYFYRDIYGYDAELKDALAKGYPYPR